MSRTNQANFFRPNIINRLAAAAIFMIVAACVYRSDRNSERSSSEPTQNNSTLSIQKNAAKNTGDKKPDNGDFLVEHLPVQNSRYAEIDRQVKNEKLLERAADKLNRSLILPYDITLRTKDCGEANAEYQPSDHSITVCYELMEHFYKLFKSTGLSDDAAYQKMFDAVRFAFLHELGHALIDAYKLPILSNEEDAADRCSSYICLTELGDEGVRAVQAAADSFAIESKTSDKNGRSLADEHLLQEQRFYNTLCMIYGSDTAKYDYLVTENYLPRERAARCPNEYERTVQSWSDLFKPWRKE
ncbi:MAG: DUF4344 domain-containing metallopeptidase [Pyrinomonadaceae bacterium]